MTGFWAGNIPAWAYVVGVLLVNAGLLTGMWIGYGRGWEHCAEDQQWAREQAKARRVHPVYRKPDERTMIPVEYRPVPVPGLGAAIWAPTPEVTHDWAAHEAVERAWLAHEEQALAVASETHGDGPSLIELDAYGGYRDEVIQPDPLTDSQWMAYQVADLDQFMAGLLGTHPATEEL